jgi:phosphoribosylformimino-5-aminoimidazole carboxamide ribotide isomerase
MRIIPAIDIIGGKCVRLTKGDYGTKKIYNEDPLEVAKQIQDSGLKYLHLVDLDGARNKKITNYRTLEKIASKTELDIDFGGGLRSDEDLKIAFNSGANQITGGSVAVTEPAKFLEWLQLYGGERIILGADCRNRKIATEGWAEGSEIDVLEFIREYISKGVIYSICTDVEKDGMMKGPSTDLYKEILDNLKVNLIASGGITTMKDIEELAGSGCEGAILGKAIYEGKLTLNELGKLC